MSRRGRTPRPVTSGSASPVQLNRGESRHRLARWLFFASRGVFRSGEYEEIINKAGRLSNAMLVWDTMVITKIVTQLRPP
jgi:TnpA family transposase